MARLTVDLPEDIGREGEDADGGVSEAELRIGRRPHGGDERPLILRWFETWATGTVPAY